MPSIPVNRQALCSSRRADRAASFFEDGLREIDSGEARQLIPLATRSLKNYPVAGAPMGPYVGLNTHLQGSRTGQTRLPLHSRQRICRSIPFITT